MAIDVSFVLRDIDGTTDNAVQPVAVQYRVGATGTFTNLPAGFVADADEVGGRYCEDCAVAPVRTGQLTAPGVMDYALDPDTATRLWTLSEELVGETFSP